MMTSEKHEILREYFHKTTPYSLPCVQKGTFEAMATTALVEESKTQPLELKGEHHKVFGKWASCCQPIDKTKDSNARATSSTPLMNVNKGHLSREHASFQMRTKVSSAKSNPEDFSKTLASVPPIAFQFHHHDNYNQYIEDYRNQYTYSRMQQANQRRHAAARLRIRTYDFQHKFTGFSAAQFNPNLNVLTPVHQQQSSISKSIVHLPQILKPIRELSPVKLTLHDSETFSSISSTPLSQQE